jgi:hypothetical protein
VAPNESQFNTNEADMLIKAKDMKGYRLSALDGEIGSVVEFYFDDRFWTVRYLVVDTGSWLTGKVVLISPYAVTSVDKENRLISVDLTKRQIEDSPSPDTDKPVSKQFEDSYYSYYNWPTYWTGPFAWGVFQSPSDARDHWDSVLEEEERSDHDLRSTRDVTGHFIEATDGEIGHVEDFVVDAQRWTIRYMVVGTRNWWPGKRVLISPLWIDRISWLEAKVFVRLTRDLVRTSPPYSDSSLLERDYETLLHEHYGQPGYWDQEHVDLKRKH